MEPLLFAFRYFSNLPIPGKAGWDEKTTAASLTWLPLTGAVIGICLAVLAIFFRNIGFPQTPALLAISIAALDLWVGSARFVDGFAKTAEGMFSGLGSKRSLEMMRDSRIGARGALGLVLAALAKVLLLAELSLQADFFYVLVFYPCWSRWAVSFCAYAYPAAEEEGMAFFFKIGQKPAYIIMGSAFMLLVLLLMPRHFYAGALLSFAALLFCNSLVLSRLGGQTEETYGLAAVATELSFLFFCALSGLLFGYIGG